MLISIVVPVYNAEKYIVKCMDSLINQTYGNIEIIVINDGSKDRTKNILDKYALNDKRIKIIHKENTGVSDTRNIGINISTGEYVCFVDADDWLDSDYIEEVVKNLKCNYPDMLLNGIIEERGNKVYYSDKHESIIFNNSISFLEQLFLYNYMNWGPVATFYSNKYIKKVQFPVDILFGEDLYFKYSIAKIMEGKIMYVPMFKYHYVRNDNSATKSYSIVKMYDDVKVMKYIIDNENNFLGDIVYYRYCVHRMLSYILLGSLSDSYDDIKISILCRKEITDNLLEIFMSKYTSFKTRIKMILIFLPKFMQKIVVQGLHIR